VKARRTLTSTKLAYTNMLQHTDWRDQSSREQAVFNHSSTEEHGMCSSMADAFIGAYLRCFTRANTFPANPKCSSQLIALSKLKYSILLFLRHSLIASAPWDQLKMHSEGHTAFIRFAFGVSSFVLALGRSCLVINRDRIDNEFYAR